jgi:hypothetical protein
LLLDKETVAELKQERLTKHKDTVIIVVKGPGLVCIPKGILLKKGEGGERNWYQPVSQAIFRIREGVVYILNKHSREEMPIGFADWKKDKDGQEYINVIIPIAR